MKQVSLFLLCCLIVLACADDEFGKRNTQAPVRELHYNMETNELIAEKLFVYDNDQNLLNEHYKALIPFVRSNEMTYEYDAQNRMVLSVYKIPGDPDIYSIAKFRYDGDKKIADEFYGNDFNAEKPFHQVIYYYSGNEPDSSVSYLSYEDPQEYKSDVTRYFKYDAEGRLLEEKMKFFDGTIYVTKINAYADDLLMQTCNPVTGQEGVMNCTRYEYNNDKTLFRIYSTYTGTPDKLLEEYTYQFGMLAEKKVFDQRYYLPPYNPDPTPYTLLVKFEY